MGATGGDAVKGTPNFATPSFLDVGQTTTDASVRSLNDVPSMSPILLADSSLRFIGSYKFHPLAPHLSSLLEQLENLCFAIVCLGRLGDVCMSPLRLVYGPHRQPDPIGACEGRAEHAGLHSQISASRDVVACGSDNGLPRYSFH